MRPVQLAKVAVQAERLRLQRFAQRTGVRVALGAMAGTFFLIALVMAHIGAIHALEPLIGVIYAPLAVAGIDLLLAIILGVVAGTSSPGKIECDAYEVREAARVQLLESLALGSLAAELFRSVGARKLVELVVALLAARRRPRGEPSRT